MATVTISIDGVDMTLSGVRLMRQRNGEVSVETPTTRDAAGREIPVIEFPPEIHQAIDRAVRKEVLETVMERAAGRAASGEQTRFRPA